MLRPHIIMKWSLDLSDKPWKIRENQVKMESAAEDALNIVGFWLAGQVKRLSPTITGRLKNSYSSATKEVGVRALNRDSGQKASQSEAVPIPSKELVVWVGSSVVYAPHIEFGTHRTGKSGSTKASSSGQHAQAPLRLALRSNKDQIIKKFINRLKKNIRLGKK